MLCVFSGLILSFFHFYWIEIYDRLNSFRCVTPDDIANGRIRCNVDIYSSIGCLNLLEMGENKFSCLWGVMWFDVIRFKINLIELWIFYFIYIYSNIADIDPVPIVVFLLPGASLRSHHPIGNSVPFFSQTCQRRFGRVKRLDSFEKPEISRSRGGLFGSVSLDTLESTFFIRISLNIVVDLSYKMHISYDLARIHFINAQI